MTATAIPIRAILLAERLDARGLDREAEAVAGLVAIADPAEGRAFGFRWGALVTVGMRAADADALAERLRPRLGELLPDPVAETAALRLDPAAGAEGGGKEGPDRDGAIRLRDLGAPRLAVVAEALARSALLSHQEATVERVLDRLDPVLARLRRGRLSATSSVMLRTIGEAIAARSRAGARVDTQARPDVLWDHPDLAALYAMLDDEWEITERSAALARKLEMVRETSETLLALVEARRSRVLELAVALLIATEVATTLYGLFAG